MSRRGMYQLMAMGALMMATAGQKNVFDYQPRQVPQPKKPKYKEYTPEEKEMMERAFEIRMEAEKHDFHIHGEVIRAKDKKTALKIWNNKYKKK